jgi:hypothetical protein
LSISAAPFYAIGLAVAIVAILYAKSATPGLPPLTRCDRPIPWYAMLMMFEPTVTVVVWSRTLHVSDPLFSGTIHFAQLTF